MKLNNLPSGLTVVPLVVVALSVLVNARPQHTHGRRHDDHVLRVQQLSSASSGSSFVFDSVAAASLTAASPTPGGTAAANASLNPLSDIPTLASSIKITHATPVALEHIESIATVFTTVANKESLVFADVPGSNLTIPGTEAEIKEWVALDVDSEADSRSLVLAPSSSSTHVALAPRATSSVTTSSAGSFDGSYQSFVLGPFPVPTSSSVAPSATAVSVCPAANGTAYTSGNNIEYEILCNVDFADNIEPFLLVGTFGGCVQKCDAYNFNNGGAKCLAAIFVPSRVNDQDDCYLKSSLGHPASPTMSIDGAVRLGYPPSSSSSSKSSSTSSSESSSSNKASSSTTSVASVTSSSKLSATASASATTTVASGSDPGVTYASGTSVILPKIASTHLQGPSQNQPSTQYLEVPNAPGVILTNSLLVVGVNGDLSTGYSISGQTGVLQVNVSTQSMLKPVTDTPHLSRDGGRGGYVNGQHLFIFCDTGSYSTTTSSSNGNFLAFVSSSVAVDVGMNGLNGNALQLQDGIGEWSDNVGRMRGFAPLTEGEQAYNQKMQGSGQRYAIWPEAALIPLNAESSLMYAPIVYDNVNMVTKAAVFTYTGATLLTVTAGGQGGPVAERTVPKIFDQGEVEFGCSGGIRSWGPSGIGGSDGKVYVFGIIPGGVLLGRTSPANVADRNTYEYWNGNSFSPGMQTSSSKAFFISGPLMDIDIFYSPRHLTFIAVYLTIYADSTFYYRYLKADKAILPPYAPGGDSSSDYVENIVKYSWSEEQVLYKASPGLSGKYIYSGGVQSRYFGSNDIYNGGSKMLISWTAPTGKDPSSADSEYQIVTAEIDWA